MSIAEHEQRIQALEAAIVELKSKVRADADGNNGGGDVVIFQTEYPLVPGVPPKASKRHKAKLSVIQHGRRDLGLSATEWSTLDLGEASE